MTRSVIGEAAENAGEHIHLADRRTTLHGPNLHEAAASDARNSSSAQPDPHHPSEDTPHDSRAGRVSDQKDPIGARFGFELPREDGWPDTDSLMSPNPVHVSDALLQREAFKPVEALNLLAAAWIQFMTHDGLDHTPTPRDSHSHSTHRWNAAQIYGRNAETMVALRTGTDGKLKTGSDSHIPRTPLASLPGTGFNDNWWLGLDLVHQLFVLEHNTIADRLAAAQPEWDDQALFDRARLINTALMAKIHTTEWTSAILQHTDAAAQTGTHWDPSAKDSPTAPHGISFAMTEEFASAHRLHSLLPDTLAIRALHDDTHLSDVPLTEVVFGKASEVVKRHALEDLFYSFGRAHPGALTLGNYPNWLRSIEVPYGGSIDLAAVDILEDRERGMPRYCAFRRMLHLSAPQSFSELTSDPELAATLERVYQGDIEQVDTMVGMFAETPPEGSGFGDTALRTFLLMSTHRLQPEQFFDTSYTREVYTQPGLDWIEDNTMKTVLIRHLPQLITPLRSVQNAFLPWEASA